MAGGIFAKELEDELMKYTTKYDHKVDTNSVEKTDDKVQIQINGGVEVNITECTKSLGSQLLVLEEKDTTESSSSFGDSNIGTENVDTLGDSEVSSGFCGDAESALGFDGFGEIFRMRKKKLTAHWRSFIRPLMWRCKWVELQVKKLESQAVKYERELEAYNKQKHTRLDNSTMVDGVKSLPFSRKNAKNDILKRKKRRRTEATMDLAAYMSQHNLFSCYENRKCLTEGAFTNNEPKNPGARKIKTEDETWSNDELSVELGDDDNSLENILRKIDFLKSQVGKLKFKTDRIRRENSDRLSIADSLILSNEKGTEGTHTSSQTTNFLTHQTAVTSHTDFPITNVEDGVLIDNQRVNEERNSFEEVKTHPTKMALDPKDGPGQTTSPLADDQSPPKIRSIAKLTAPKSKRKRGRKRVASGRRSRRSSGRSRSFICSSGY